MSSVSRQLYDYYICYYRRKWVRKYGKRQRDIAFHINIFNDHIYTKCHRWSSTSQYMVYYTNIYLCIMNIWFQCPIWLSRCIALRNHIHFWVANLNISNRNKCIYIYMQLLYWRIHIDLFVSIIHNRNTTRWKSQTHNVGAVCLCLFVYLISIEIHSIHHRVTPSRLCDRRHCVSYDGLYLFLQLFAHRSNIATKFKRDMYYVWVNFCDRATTTMTIHNNTIYFATLVLWIMYSFVGNDVWSTLCTCAVLQTLFT